MTFFLPFIAAAHCLPIARMAYCAYKYGIGNTAESESEQPSLSIETTTGDLQLVEVTSSISSTTSAAMEDGPAKNECRIVGFPLDDIRAFTLAISNPYMDLILSSSSHSRALILRSNSSSSNASDLLASYNTCRIVGFPLDYYRNLALASRNNACRVVGFPLNDSRFLATTGYNDCRALALTSNINDADNDSIISSDVKVCSAAPSSSSISSTSTNGDKQKINYIQRNIDDIPKISAARSAAAAKPKRKSRSPMFVMSPSNQTPVCTYQPKLTVGKAPHLLTEDRSMLTRRHCRCCCELGTRSSRAHSHKGRITY